MTDEELFDQYAQVRAQYGGDVAHQALLRTISERDAPNWKARYLWEVRSLSQKRYTDGRDMKKQTGTRKIAEQLHDWQIPAVVIDIAELVTLWRVLRSANPRLLSYVVDDHYEPKQLVRLWRQELRAAHGEPDHG